MAGLVHDFTEALSRRMEEQGVSRAELARRLDTSQAYVTKVLRGNVNFTRATLVKLARAVGGEVRLDLCELVLRPDRSAERAVRPVRRPAVSRAARVAKAKDASRRGRSGGWPGKQAFDRMKMN